MTDAPCPRCRTPLRVAQGGVHLADELAGAAVLHECPSCRGVFLDNTSLQSILSRRGVLAPNERPAQFVDGTPPALPERGRYLDGTPPATPERGHYLDQVRYLPCPLCKELMNRVNFGRRSGVIVDVCAAHGTWFDAGELARAVNFVAKGGLLESRRMEAKEKRELARAAARLQAELACDERAGPTLGGWEGRLSATWGEHRGTLLEILAWLFQ